MQVGARRDALLGGALLGATLNLQWLANVFSHLMRLPVELVREAPPGRHRVALRRACSTIQQTLTTELRRGAARRRDGARHAGDDAGLQRRSPASRWRAVAGLRAAALGLLRAAAATRPRRHIVFAAKQHEPFPRDRCAACRRSSCSTRQEERRARWLNLVVDAMNRDLATQKLELDASACQRAAVRRRAHRIVWLGALLVLDSAFSVGMLFAFIAYKEQFCAARQRPDRQDGRPAACSAAGRAAGRHRADAARAAVRAALAARRRGGRRSSCAASAFRYSDTEPCGAADCSLRSSRASRWRSSALPAAARPRSLKLMLGLHAPTDGEILVGGVAVSAARHATRYREHGRHGDAGRPALRRVDRRQHQLLRSRARPGVASSSARAWPRSTTTSPRCRWDTTR